MKNKRPLFLFGDVVVVDADQIGVVVKTWENNKGFAYEVYVRMYNKINVYEEKEMDRYRIRHKYLDEEDLMYQNS